MAFLDKIKKGFSLDLFQTCDEIGDLRNGDLPLLDTLEKDQIVGERYEKERDTFFDETSAHLCEYLNLNLADNEDPFVKLSQEADAQRDEMEASRKRVLDKRQAYKDLEKSYNELKQTYRDLVEEKSNFDKHEVNQNSKLFTKMSTILNATYKTNSEGKAIAGTISQITDSDVS